jgi:hypothetical protein
MERRMLREQQKLIAPLRRSDYYQMIRSQIDAENQLANMRVIWLLIAEAFFVGGYATLLNAQEQAKNQLYAVQQELLFWVLPLAALIAGLLACAGVVASAKRVAQFEEFYTLYEERTAQDESTEGYPPLQNHGLVHWLTAISLVGLPILFVILWGIVLVIQIATRLAG